MQHVASWSAPRDNIFAVLASSARRRSDAELGAIAAASGVVALAGAARGGASWVLLAVCYVVWAFAGWGILFRSTARRTRAWRALELFIAASAAGVAITAAIGIFFWSLGSHWQL